MDPAPHPGWTGPFPVLKLCFWAQEWPVPQFWFTPTTGLFAPTQWCWASSPWDKGICRSRDWRAKIMTQNRTSESQNNYQWTKKEDGCKANPDYSDSQQPQRWIWVSLALTRVAITISIPSKDLSSPNLSCFGYHWYSFKPHKDYTGSFPALIQQRGCYS